jgi:hypothetical protein
MLLYWTHRCCYCTQDGERQHSPLQRGQKGVESAWPTAACTERGGGGCTKTRQRLAPVRVAVCGVARVRGGVRRELRRARQQGRGAAPRALGARRPLRARLFRPLQRRALLLLAAGGQLVAAYLRRRGCSIIPPQSPSQRDACMRSLQSCAIQNGLQVRHADRALTLLAVGALLSRLLLERLLRMVICSPRRRHLSYCAGCAGKGGRGPMQRHGTLKTGWEGEAHL